ncbi:uncharacterized [Tachysurus ichikawai]
MTIEAMLTGLKEKAGPWANSSRQEKRAVCEAERNLKELVQSDQSTRLWGRKNEGITCADGAVTHEPWLTGAQVAMDGVGADGILITRALATDTLITL